jgi:MFS family permease
MPKIKTLNHTEHYNRSMIKVLTLISFLLGASSAFILYLESDYLKTAAKSENITYFYLFAYALALILICNWHHLIRAFGKTKVFLANLTLKTLVILFLAFFPVSFMGAWILALYMTLTTLAWIDLDILFETFSKDKFTGSIRGFYLTIISAGYLFSQFFSGMLVDRFGFQASFKAALFFILAVLAVSYLKIRKVPERQSPDIRFSEVLAKILKRKNVLRAYYISFLLQFFYALMIIYTPLKMLDLGFNWTEIGEIFAIMLIPFVIFQYPAGKLADKKIEEKWILAFALFLMGIFTSLIYFLNIKDMVLWATILFFTRVGASLVELASDSYFYKRIDCEDVDIIEFFRNVRPIGYLLGIAIAAPITYYFGISAIFPVVGILAITGIPFALKLASSRVPPVCHQPFGKIKR